MTQRDRVLMLIPRLSRGGAEQVMTLLARGLSPEKYDLHLGLVMTSQENEEHLPPWVTVHPLGAERARFAALKLLALVRKLRPEAVLSGAAEISFLALLLQPFFPSRTSVVVRQNGTASAVLESGRLPWYTRSLYRMLYRRADRLICQSHAMAHDLAQVTGINEERIAVLPNPVDVEGIRKAAEVPAARTGKGPHLLAVGRLSHEKGFDLLLEALAQVREQFPDADLIVAGSGQEEASLKEKCHALRLDAAVSFVGYVHPVYAFFAGASLFVLPSRYEGMPNALLEAAAAGLPLVATPASGGLVKLLRNEPGAWLTPEISAEALAATLIVALSSLQPGMRFQHTFFPSPTA